MTRIQIDLQHIKMTDTKIVFVTGGVCSSIGKGVLITAIGVLLKNAGHSVSVMKWDPYLNVDPGTMSPTVHGEVFITADGAETDLDLGHYERHLDITLTRDSSMTAGQVYQEVLTGERAGRYLGQNVQVIPHVVNIIKERLLKFVVAAKVDFVLIEIGGTVGDIEADIFLEAVRQLRMDLGCKHVMHGHLSYVPCLSWSDDVKTKPTQHSVIALKRAGLVPDSLFLRADKALTVQQLQKLSVLCSVPAEMIFQVLTHDPMYELFFDLAAQSLTVKIQEYFDIKSIRLPDLAEWEAYVHTIKTSTVPLSVGLIVKYAGNDDPYISVIDALRAAAYHAGRKIDLVVIAAENLEQSVDNPLYDYAMSQLQSVAGIVVPGGFGRRGVEGKIIAAQFARENKVPFLGLCLGMQVMVIEAARSLLGLPQANSLEFDELTPDPVVTLMEQQKGVAAFGGTMRLGSYSCTLLPGSKAQQAYDTMHVVERHRHRFEINNMYRERLVAEGVVFSGINKELELIEITEINGHPFMVGSQFHPEFTSSPLKVNPLFRAFIEAASIRHDQVFATLNVVPTGNHVQKNGPCFC